MMQSEREGREGHIATELLHQIEQCLDYGSQLEALLRDELSALESQDVSALRSIASNKELCVRSMESLESERRTLCTRAGFAADEAGMSDMLKWCDQSNVVTPVWNSLLQCIKRCESLNRTNGAICRMRYEHVVNVLTVFSGGSGTAETYGPGGHSAPRFEQHALARI
jgi:flagella synthesis protein FlgN